MSENYNFNINDLSKKYQPIKTKIEYFDEKQIAVLRQKNKREVVGESTKTVFFEGIQNKKLNVSGRFLQIDLFKLK